ncbi:MAG: 2-C-methyl-D-erythritol 2,4-cyclodiphosphate synthase [Coprobacillus sp.]|nr:2-C-methyl-D-erythritol 2,4-cyclodiphosphate synthase [Coprobacillus sp.]
MDKVGVGVDIHPLVKNRPLIIGGVTLPSKKGEKAHSDGDVLYHALVDALLGALDKGSIGDYFPSSDPKYKDIDSSFFVFEIKPLVIESGYRIANIDACIQLESPMISEYVPIMRDNIYALLSDLGLAKESISIKGGTNEGIGKIGKGKAVSAIVSVLLYKEEDK